MLTLSKTERNGPIKEKSRGGEDGWAAQKSAAFRKSPREDKASCYEKGQPARVGLVVLVEVAGIFGTSLCLILWAAALRRSAALLALLVEPESF